MALQASYASLEISEAAFNFLKPAFSFLKPTFNLLKIAGHGSRKLLEKFENLPDLLGKLV